MIGSIGLYDLGQNCLHGIRKDGSPEDVVNQPSDKGECVGRGLLLPFGSM